MDKYHIYEEIGKGDFSQVFKGREKKKIEYVAIKRIEKSVMAKIVNEVQVMHKLSSPHMLRFYDWYETRNNLWLILEYCTGGDLEALIKQDGHLPETSVRIFGLDLLAAVQYIHGKGMIHCDIRPRNFLVDEYGILKMADFKFARKIPKDPLGESPLSERGTPAYMAPELFTPEGVHSFQSDFWALGCVLYQLRRGTLPFGESTMNLQNLIENINTVEPINTPLPVLSPEGAVVNPRLAHPPVTADLADLLMWLLEKSPANRCNWTSICAHPFWSPNNPAPPETQHAQPALDTYCRDLARSQAQALESSSIAEFGVRLDGSLDFTGAGGAPLPPVLGTGSTPLKLPQTMDSTPIRATNGAQQQQVQGDHHSMAAARSQAGIALATEGPGASQRHSATTALSTPPHTGAASTTAVHQVTPERNTSAAQQAAAALTNTKHSTQTQPTTTTAAPTSAAALEQQRSPRAVPSTPPPRTPALDNSALPEGDLSFQNTPTALPIPPTAAPAQPRENISGQTAAVDLLSLFPAHTLLQHSSDTQVKSIAGNKQIEAIERLPFKADNSLPAAALTVDQIVQLSALELEGHLSAVYKALQKTLAAAQPTNSIPTAAAAAALADRLNLLGYLNSIASCAEVANVVLNTSFLTLLLKIMKNNTLYSAHTPGSRSAAGSNAAVNLAATMNVHSLQGRVWAATVLAVMLRFVSDLKPPTIRTREDHIVPSIVAILRDPAKLDVRLKRRAVAALGETVFYISAQTEEVGVERWSLPPQAVEALVDCLREENDEVVKHYAVKTIENVFAQGAVEFRRRFVSLELAVRLMEMSQSSKNEHLQGSCGMAAAHLLYLVQTAHHYAPAPQTPGASAGGAGAGGAAGNNLNSTGRVAVNSRGGSSGGLGSTATLNTTATLNDVFAIPSAVRGAKFLAKVLEKGGMPGMMEVLRDGPQKLQQAYLNIINLVFSAPLMPTAPLGADPAALAAATSPANLQAINVALRMSRSFFLKSPTLLPQLVNLVEQGGVSAIRGKALLAAQLVSAAAPSFLSALAERRLPNLLVRALAPVFSALEGDPAQAPNPSTYAYFSKSALSMLGFLRATSVRASVAIADQLAALATNALGALSTETDGTGVHSPSPTKTAPGQRPSPASPRTMHATPGPMGTPSAAVAQGGAVSASELQTQATLLSAVASSAAQPALRRLIVSTDETVVHMFARAVQLLPSARRALQKAAGQIAQNKPSSKGAVNGDGSAAAVVAGLEAALQGTEHACMIMLEMVAQSEFGSPGAETVKILRAVMEALIPAAAGLLGHSDGDTRVVVSAALRRLVPAALQACWQLSAADPSCANLLGAGQACISALCAHSATLLGDQAPIPQYHLRLVVDVTSICAVFSQACVEELVRNGAVEALIRMLRPQSNGQDDDGDVTTAGGDAQLAVLLRQIFETSDFGLLLLRCDLAPALTEAAIAAVYATLNEPLSQYLVAPTARTAKEFFSGDALASHEGVIRLLELVQVVLYRVMRLQPTDDKPSPQGELARRQVATMRGVSPAVLAVVAYTSTFLRLAGDSESSPGEAADPTAVGAYTALLDCSTRCLALLFDLFPDSLTTQLLSRASILLDNRSESGGGTRQKGLLLPRAVFADVLLNPQVEIKTRHRLLKVLTVLCKVATAANFVAPLKEMLTTAPLAPALVSSSRAADVTTNMRTFSGSLHVNDINSFVRVASQLCEIGARL